MSKARFCDKAPNPAIPEEKDVMEEMIAASEVETRQAMVILTLVSQDIIKHHEQLYKRDLSGYAELKSRELVSQRREQRTKERRNFRDRGGSGALFRQRLQIGDNVLPVFFVRHAVDHLRSSDELAGALEVFVKGLLVLGDVRPLHCRRILIAGLRPDLAAEHTGQ